MEAIKAMIERWHHRRSLKRKAVALEMSRDRIQLCEYNKATYISVGGVPVINVAHLSREVYDVLEDARQVSSSYISERS
jgi:hypothetical protein